MDEKRIYLISIHKYHSFARNGLKEVNYKYIYTYLLPGYWQTIGYLLAQLHGLADGYEAKRADGGQHGQRLTVEDGWVSGDPVG